VYIGELGLELPEDSESVVQIHVTLFSQKLYKYHICHIINYSFSLSILLCVRCVRACKNAKINF
jgi:hypothetical protein